MCAKYLSIVCEYKTPEVISWSRTNSACRSAGAPHPPSAPSPSQSQPRFLDCCGSCGTLFKVNKLSILWHKCMWSTAPEDLWHRLQTVNQATGLWWQKQTAALRQQHRGMLLTQMRWTQSDRREEHRRSSWQPGAPKAPDRALTVVYLLGASC